MDENKNVNINADQSETPNVPLEITPSKEPMERPLWQKVAAWIMIAMTVAATGACAFWPKL